MSSPLVSICLPNLNTRPFLEERMETILGQSFNDWELIISDNHSTDGAWEFFQTFKSDPRIRMFQSPRRGMYANWNECLQRARGRYAYIATSDDTMSPDCLASLVLPLERRPELKIAVCDCQEIDEQGRPLRLDATPAYLFYGQWMHTPSIRNGKTEFLFHAGFGTTMWKSITCVMFRRDLLQDSGYFPTNRGSQGDEEWTLRACLASDVAYVPGRLATWRIHPKQATSHWNIRQQRRVPLDCIETVMDDPHADIPAEWKQLSGWKDKITEMHRHNHRLTYKLFRWELRRNPVRFLQDAWDALLSEPDWLWTQARHGFTWNESRAIDLSRHAQQLLEIFHAPWPPKAVEGRW